MYTDFKDSCTNLVPVQNVVYRALEELEKKFDPKVLRVLFSPGILMEYPDLELISKDFENVLPQNKLWSKEIARRDRNSQLSLEQGHGDSCCQESLTWSPSGPSSSDEWRSNDGGKTTLTQGSQTENHQFSILQIHNDSCELKVQLSDRDASLEPHIPLPCSNERAELPRHGIKIYPCSVNPVNIKQENSSVFLSSEHQTHTRTDHNQASEIIDLTRDNSDDGPRCSEESTSVTCQSSKDAQRARQAVGICSQEPVNSRNLPTSINTHRRRGMSDTDSSSTRKRQRRTRRPRIPKQFNVDFNIPELPVTCGTAKGTLYREKFKKGTHEKSILTENGEWLTLREFEIRGDHEKSKNWKKSIQCYGYTLGYLIEKGSLPNPPTMKKKARRSGICGNDNRVHERPTQGYAGSTPSVLHTTEERGLSRPLGAHADKQNQEQAELEGIPLSTTFCGEHAPHLSEPQHSHIMVLPVEEQHVLLVVKDMWCELNWPQLKQLSCCIVFQVVLFVCLFVCFLQIIHLIYLLTAITFLKPFRYRKLFHTLGLAISKLKRCSSKFKVPFIKGNCHALWVITEHILPDPLAEERR
ncbi:nuclear autoantigen Sp-100-like isoform X3 [Microtus pennsylvanicus]